MEQILEFSSAGAGDPFGCGFGEGLDGDGSTSGGCGGGEGSDGFGTIIGSGWGEGLDGDNKAIGEGFSNDHLHTSSVGDSTDDCTDGRQILDELGLPEHLHDLFLPLTPRSVGAAQDFVQATTPEQRDAVLGMLELGLDLGHTR